MLAFQILVNGNVVCTAGVGPDGRVFASALSWTHRQPEQVSFTVGGVPETDQHLDWNAPEISVGDEITIRIIETDEIDAPDSARPKIDRTA